MKTFKPMLAPNDKIKLDEIKYPLLASYKLDGIRCIFYKGQILSRSLKQIQNKQLREKFEPIRKFTEDNDIILDGEIYSPKLTFQEITSFVMTKDLTESKTVKKNGGLVNIPEHLKFYCFDYLQISWGQECSPFYERIGNLSYTINDLDNDNILFVVHKKVNNKEEVEQYFEKALKDGYEGLILRDPNGRYKCGRGTVKEGLIYKIKPFQDFDGKIIDVVQSTVVDQNAEKTINELGRSVTSKKKDDRILIEKASAFTVMYEGKKLKVTLAMTDKEKEFTWKNREAIIGNWITYKAMEVGMKEDGLPRHPIFKRFRDEK